jgi:hypothetical protein
MSDNEDFVGSAKKDILKKLKDSGAPDSVISAVDFLSPDDLTDLATSIAFAAMPVPMLGKATKAAIGALKKTAPAAKKMGPPISAGPRKATKETMEDVRRMKKQGEPEIPPELVLGGMAGTAAAAASEKRKEDEEKKKKKKEPKSQVMGVRG